MTLPEYWTVPEVKDPIFSFCGICIDEKWCHSQRMSEMLELKSDRESQTSYDPVETENIVARALDYLTFDLDFEETRDLGIVCTLEGLSEIFSLSV